MLQDEEDIGYCVHQTIRFFSKALDEMTTAVIFVVTTLLTAVE